MTLQQAVKKLGGPHRVAGLVGVPRTSIIYWMSKKPPKWRQSEVDRIIVLAQESQKAA